VEKNSPIAAPKARKNAAERAGLQAAHVRDGVAMAKFLCWIEAAVAGGEAVTEISAAAKAEEFRAQQGRFAGLSFPTISASGPNGAITHYGVSEETSRALTADEMFLCDSGAQYLDGTTDVTRTIHFAAEPPAEQRRCFTRVMQGHIALADARFVPGTTGFQLDVLARQPLWRDGLAYAHGTGHGVGAYLGVHEGPHSISFSQRPPDAAIEPGFTTSIEPGYYLEGRFGIRIENIMLTVAETLTPPAGPALDVLRFEPLTLIPFQRRLLDTALLAPHEVAYLDAYHARVWREVSPALAAGPHACANTLDWLREATRPLA
jgi:Xaa-Pro aminopeptidase